MVVAKLSSISFSIVNHGCQVATVLSKSIFSDIFSRYHFWPRPCLSCRLMTQQASQATDEAEADAESYEVRSFTTAVDGDVSADTKKTDYGEPIMWDRRVPYSLREYNNLTVRPRQQLVDPKYLRVSIIGSPNAGKSTLTNQIVGWRVCSTSSKVHTTRRNTLAIMTENNVQIVLVDTPGVINKEHGAKHHLERSLVVDPENSLQTVDVIAVIVDASKKFSEYGMDQNILHMLYRSPYQDAVLILNKVDLIKKKSKLLEISRTMTCGVVDSQPVPRYEPIESHLTKAQKGLLWREQMERKLNAKDPEEMFWNEVDEYAKLEKYEDRRMLIARKKGWPRFKEVFMISALDGDGIEELKSYFMRTAYTGDWRFNPNLVSNQSPREIVLMAVREKLLDNLRLKLPYQINLYLKEWEIDERGTLLLTVRLKCPRKGAMKHVMGENGKRIREIAYEAGQGLMNTFRCEVLLKLIVCY